MLANPSDTTALSAGCIVPVSHVANTLQAGIRWNKLQLLIRLSKENRTFPATGSVRRFRPRHSTPAGGGGTG